MISIHVMNADAKVVISLVGNTDLLNKVEAATKERCIFTTAVDWRGPRFRRE